MNKTAIIGIAESVVVMAAIGVGVASGPPEPHKKIETHGPEHNICIGDQASVSGQLLEPDGTTAHHEQGVLVTFNGVSIANPTDQTDPDGYASLTYTPTVGNKTVQAAAPDYQAYHEPSRFAVVEVQSLAPDEGTKVDTIQTGPDNVSTDVWIVPWEPDDDPSAPGPFVNVPATPNPDVSLADLPPGWSLREGEYGDPIPRADQDGDGVDDNTGETEKLAKVDKSDPGSTLVIADAGTSHKRVLIHVVKVSFTAQWSIAGVGGTAPVEYDSDTNEYSCKSLAGTRVKLTAHVSPANIGTPHYQWTSSYGSFYDSYHIDAVPLSDTDRQSVYWESDSFSQPDEMVTVHVTFDSGSTGNGLERQKGLSLRGPAAASGGDVPGKLKLQHRTLATGSHGSDVKQVQQLLNFLGYGSLAVNGAYDPNTDAAVATFKNANRGTWTHQNGIVTADVAKSLNKHYENYLKARNAFGWNNGTNPNANNATIGQDDPRFKKDDQNDESGWVENAAAQLTHLPGGIITPAVSWGSDKRRLLLAIIAQESSSVHWKNWKITVSGVGAIGFMQVMPFNCGKFNPTQAQTIVPKTVNPYRPDENLIAGAMILDHYLDKAFYGYSVGGDQAVDLLAKALAEYNGGKSPTLESHSWQSIVQNNLHPSIGYALDIKQRLGLALHPYEQQWLDVH